MRPRINSKAICSVDADGPTYAEDSMAACSNNAKVRNTAEALVVDPLLLKIARIIMIPSNHHDPIVRFSQSARNLRKYLLIITGRLKSKPTVSRNDKQGIFHSIPYAQFENHFLKSSVDVSADNNVFDIRIIK